MERILVTGATGLLGRQLVEVLSKKYEVIPTYHAGAMRPDSVRMDIVDRDMVFRVIGEMRPWAVVHSAAETDVDKCETNKEWAWSVNVGGTSIIAEGCVKVGAKLIYISTDYVFDGARGLYREDDRPNPLNYYGLTKLRGEESVRRTCPSYVVARTSVLYGWHPKRLNFATWVINSLRSGKRISVVDDHYNSPTLADSLAEGILEVVGRDVGGFFHVCGKERISRYEFAIRIADIFGLDKSLIARARMDDLKAWIARRPRDSSLCVERAERELGVDLLSVDEGLRRMRGPKFSGEMVLCDEVADPPYPDQEA